MSEGGPGAGCGPGEAGRGARGALGIVVSVPGLLLRGPQTGQGKGGLKPTGIYALTVLGSLRSRCWEADSF